MVEIGKEVVVMGFDGGFGEFDGGSDVVGGGGVVILVVVMKIVVILDGGYCGGGEGIVGGGYGEGDGEDGGCWRLMKEVEEMEVEEGDDGEK